MRNLSFSYSCRHRPFSRGVIGLGLIGLFFSSQAVWAASNLKLGSLEVHPFVQVTESLDDNICRSESQDCPKDGDFEKGRDSIALFNPGLLLILPLKEHELQAEYSGRFARYREFKDENYNDNTLRGGMALNFPGGLSIRAEDIWVDGHDPRGFAQNVELDFYKKNTASASIKQEVGTRFAVEGRYTHFILDYEESRNDFRDRTDNTVGGTVFYHFLPKSSALVEYNFTSVAFDEGVGPISRDSTVQQVFTGLTYEITAKSKGTLKGGYERKQFEEEDRRDFSGGVVSIELGHELTSRTLIQATVERRTRESNLESEDYYVTTGGGVQVTQRFTGKLSALLQTSYGRDQYPDAAGVEGRTDNTYRTGIGMDYWIQKWFSVAARYDYANRDSDLEGLDYTDHLYSVSLGLFF